MAVCSCMHAQTSLWFCVRILKPSTFTRLVLFLLICLIRHSLGLRLLLRASLWSCKRTKKNLMGAVNWDRKHLLNYENCSFIEDWHEKVYYRITIKTQKQLMHTTLLLLLGSLHFYFSLIILSIRMMHFFHKIVQNNLIEET